MQVALRVLMWSPSVAMCVEARGAVLGLNITFASFGWLSATVLGGFGLAGAVLSLVHWLWPRVAGTALVVATGER